jgi:hypothetical protein
MKLKTVFIIILIACVLYLIYDGIYAVNNGMLTLYAVVNAISCIISILVLKSYGK